MILLNRLAVAPRSFTFFDYWHAFLNQWYSGGMRRRDEPVSVQVPGRSGGYRRTTWKGDGPQRLRRADQGARRPLPQALAQHCRFEGPLCCRSLRDGRKGRAPAALIHSARLAQAGNYPLLHGFPIWSEKLSRTGMLLTLRLSSPLSAF